MASKVSQPPVITCEFIASFPTLVSPRAIKNTDGTLSKPKYSITAVFPPKATQKYLVGAVDITPLKQAAQACAIADPMLGKEKLAALLKIGKFRSPFLDADAPDPGGGDFTVGEKYGWPKGATYLRFSSVRKPRVVSCYPDDTGRPAFLTPEEIEEKVYAGARCRASVRPYTYNVNGNRGVTFDLRGVQWLGDGERLDGRGNAQEEFSPTADAADLEDPEDDAGADTLKKVSALADRKKSLEDLL